MALHRLVHLAAMTPITSSHVPLAAAPTADLEPTWNVAELARRGTNTLLKERMLNRPGHGSGGVLSVSSSFK